MVLEHFLIFLYGLNSFDGYKNGLGMSLNFFLLTSKTFEDQK